MSITVTLPDSVIEWLKTGERGISSETIISHLYQLPINQRQDHPYDTPDVGRCIKLLDACPEVRDRFDEMRTLSPVWDSYVSLWPEIEATYRAGEYHAVYALCRRCREEAR